MLTNCLAVCAHLTITVSKIQRDIGRKSSIFSYRPCIRRPLGSRWNSATPFGMENENGLATTWWKNFKDIFIRFGATHERDRRTDGQMRRTDRQTDRRTPHAGNSRAMHSIARQNRHFYVPRPSIFVCPGDACVAITQNGLSQCVSPKIAIFTTFLFPLERPWGNHAKCCMDGKRIRCLQIVSLHVPI